MGKIGSHEKMAVTNTYYSTFISGLSDIIKRQAENFKIKLVLDGLIIYETELKPEKIQTLPFFNNSFFLIEYLSGKANNLEKLISNTENFIHKKVIPPDILIGKNSFRVIISKENELQHIAPLQLRKLENIFSKKLKLPVDRANPDIEVWFLERSEGYTFCGIRLTKKPSTDKYLQKGALRPELAWILCYLSEPKKTHIFLDPFAGHGSIPFACTNFPNTKIIASDNNTEKIALLKQKVKEKNKKIEVQNWDATKLPLKNNSVDAIVTDPPWGIFEKENIEELYEKVFVEFARVLKPSGTFVILTAQKELMEKLIKKYNNLFLLKEKYDILVSGKKAGVYKLVKQII